MNIKFTFIYNIKNNSFFLKKPDKKSKKFEKLIIDNFKTKKYDKIDQGQRVEVDFGPKLKIYMIKKQDYFFGLLGDKIRTKKEIYNYLEKFFKKYKQEPKIHKKSPIFKWLKDEMLAFKNGEKITKEELIFEQIRSTTMRVEQQMMKGIEIGNQLTLLDEDLEDMKNVAKENKETATEVKKQAFWYNQKLTIFMMGIFGIFFLIILLYVSKLIL